MRAPKSVAVVCLAAMFLLAPLVMAQKTAAEAPKYDVAKEVTIKGTVEEIKEVPNPKGQIGIYLMVKSGGECSKSGFARTAFSRNSRSHSTKATS